MASKQDRFRVSMTPELRRRFGLLRAYLSVHHPEGHWPSMSDVFVWLLTNAPVEEWHASIAGKGAFHVEEEIRNAQLDALAPAGPIAAKGDGSPIGYDGPAYDISQAPGDAEHPNETRRILHKLARCQPPGTGDAGEVDVTG